MSFNCPNCSTESITFKKTPNILQIFEEFFGDLDIAEKETLDILQELCSKCGTLPEFLPFVEKQLKLSNIENFEAILKEFIDNLHTPFLLQIGSPIFTFLVRQENEEIQQLAIDAYGEFGALDDLGRYVLANLSPKIQVMGLRALEKIAKQYKKIKKEFNWTEYINYILGDRKNILDLLGDALGKPGFLTMPTIEILKPILEKFRIQMEEL